MKKEEFIKTFKEVANKDDILKMNWNASSYTEIIKKNILKVIASKLNTEFVFEYWKIDCIYYDKKNVFEEYGRGIWLKKIDVMIEHENYHQRAFEEVIKLCLWKADLKVLITYYKDVKKINEYIKEWDNIIRNMSYNENENILIILGNDKKRIFDKYYEWNNKEKKFKLIN